MVFPGIQHAASIQDYSNLVQIYPNPVSEQLFILGLERPTSIEIIDTNGKNVKTIKNFNASHLDVSGFTQGIYYMRLTNDKMTEVHKIIIQ